MTEIGNIFARCGYNLPTCDLEHAHLELTSFYALISLLDKVGEQNAIHEKRPGILPPETLIAAAAIYESLFTKKTIGQLDPETTQSILIDTLQNEYMFDDLDLQELKK